MTLEKAECQALARYFFLLTMDTQQAEHLASQAADKLERLLKKKNYISKSLIDTHRDQRIQQNQNKQNRQREELLVEAAEIQSKSSVLEISANGQAFKKNHNDWYIPNSFDWTSWKIFLQKTDPNEIKALAWVHAIGFSREAVAKALGISIGALNLRLENSVRSFLMIKSSTKPAEKRNLKVVRKK